MPGEQRLSVFDVDPKATEAVLGLERYVENCGLDRQLYELVKIRASQINGCAFCMDMHNREARSGGEEQRRLDVVSAWREAADLFTDQERAALALTEAVTLVADGGVSDAIWSDATTCFDDGQVVGLLMAIATINVWNRLAVTTHQQIPGLRQA